MLQTIPSQIRSSRCLLTLCLSARDMASHTLHGTGRHGTAGHSRVPLPPPQIQILTRLRNLVHSQHYSPGHTATAHTPARKEK